MSGLSYDENSADRFDYLERKGGTKYH